MLFAFPDVAVAATLLLLDMPWSRQFQVQISSLPLVYQIISLFKKYFHSGFKRKHGIIFKTNSLSTERWLNILQV
jgi:hypothetical protein